MKNTKSIGSVDLYPQSQPKEIKVLARFGISKKNTTSTFLGSQPEDVSCGADSNDDPLLHFIGSEHSRYFKKWKRQRGLGGYSPWDHHSFCPSAFR